MKLSMKHTKQQRSRRFGAILKQLREAMGISARKLGAMAGLPSASVSHYENGLQTPAPESLQKIADAMGAPTEVLSWFAYTRPPTSPAAEKLLFGKVEGLMMEQVDELEERFRKKRSRGGSTTP